MTTLAQFAQNSKMRHDYADMIQLRYTHIDGEAYDTWISGDEVMARLKTLSREQLIRSFSQMEWQTAKERLQQELENQKGKQKRKLIDRIADQVEGAVGGNIFGETLAAHIRSRDNTQSSQEQEKAFWQAKLREDAFRAIALELAWLNLEGSLPDLPPPEPDDWV